MAAVWRRLTRTGDRCGRALQRVRHAGIGMEAVWGAALALCVGWCLLQCPPCCFGPATPRPAALTLTAEQAAPADAAWRALGMAGGAGVSGRQRPSAGVDALRDSFAAMPAAVLPAAADLRQLAEAAGWLFATGVQLALRCWRWRCCPVGVWHRRAHHAGTRHVLGRAGNSRAGADGGLDMGGAAGRAQRRAGHRTAGRLAWPARSEIKPGVARWIRMLRFIVNPSRQRRGSEI